MKSFILRANIPHCNALWQPSGGRSAEVLETEFRRTSDGFAAPTETQTREREQRWQSNSIKIQWAAIQIHTHAKQRANTHFSVLSSAMTQSPQSNWIHSFIQNWWEREASIGHNLLQLAEFQMDSFKSSLLSSISRSLNFSSSTDKPSSHSGSMRNQSVS